MFKRCLSLLAVGLTLPTPVLSDTLQLPTEAVIDVRVIETTVLDAETPGQANLLLRPAPRAEAEHRLPEYCLITADARLTDDRVRLTANTLTCIDAQGDNREIFTGELSAAARERDGNLGLDVCSRQADESCQRAELRPEHDFQLRLGRALRLESQANPSAQVNEQRRDTGNDSATDADAD